jgi:predicted Rdx family selenoprotein
MTVPSYQADLDAAMQKSRVDAVCAEWYRTRQFPKSMLVNGRLYQQDAEFVDQIVRIHFDGIYSLETLDKAYSTLVAHKTLATDLTHYFESNPEFSTDQNWQIAQSWMAQNLTATLKDFLAYVEEHRLDGTFEWRINTENLVNLVRTANGVKLAELKQQYGKSAVENALQILESRIHRIAGRHDWTQENEKAREEARKKDASTPGGQFLERLREQQCKNQLEAIVSTFSRSNNHSQRAEDRALLDSIRIYKDEEGTVIDYVATLAAVKQKADELASAGTSIRTNYSRT